MKLQVLGNTLDKEQTKAATLNNRNSIIIAGAGSGKSLTMVGKIKYLVIEKNININNILCITFTNEAASSLEKKITQELNIPNKVYTFHKLALEILDDNKINYQIAPSDLLDYLINEILFSIPSNYFNKLFLNKNYQDSALFLQYKNIISRFIKLYMGNFSNKDEFSKIINKAPKKDQPTLQIIKKFYEIYTLEKESQRLIDFDDMINLATNIVHTKGIKKNYQYIIIDEYQDTSLTRQNLIKEIISKTKALITVVGDDFQSIYRFSGCDLTNFLDFKKHFKHVKKLYLTNTYRNSQELIKVAGSFIMQNPRQIKKNLKSTKHIAKPIVIIYYHNLKKDFTKALAKINTNDLLILGRNNKDIFQIIDSKYLNNNQIIYNNKTIDYKTIHKSKGLESTNILIVNLTNNTNSLPSKIEDNAILKYVLIHKDIYPFEEERRLFYVALTRTKNYCYLFVPKKNPSIFVEELIKNYSKYITFINL